MAATGEAVKTTEHGGLNLPLLEELVMAGASSADLHAEGYTSEETVRARIVSSLRTTSDTVSIGPESDAKHSSPAIRQPRRGVAAGFTPSGPTGALERSPGTAEAPRGGRAEHRYTETRTGPA